MSKKGFLSGAMYYVILAFVFSLVLIFMLIIIDQWNSGIQANNSSLMPAESQAISQNYTNTFRRADIGLGYLFFGFMIVSVIVARFHGEVKPVWIVIGLMALIVIGFTGMILENIWSGINADPNITNITEDLVFIPFLMNHFVATLIGYVAVVVVARMTRSGGGFGL